MASFRCMVTACDGRYQLEPNNERVDICLWNIKYVETKGGPTAERLFLFDPILGLSSWKAFRLGVHRFYMLPFRKQTRRQSAPARSHTFDVEAQVSRDGGGEKPCKPGSHMLGSTCQTFSTSTEKSSPRNSYGVEESSSQENTGTTLNNPIQSESGWKPWKLDDPYRTDVPKDEQAMEKWVQAMKESDDGMCQGWTDQIDTLIIFAGLFSATVTAFTIESYRWLEETQVDMVARLQLRALLNAAHDPAVDRLAPTTFQISTSAVLINTLWFASLTLALGAVVISILCKQWLYEYQRYDNLTIKEIFLIRGLRYRGLKAWRVPAIIGFLPILLQAALVLFLVGLLVLLGPLQKVVAGIITAIVGIFLLFMMITTILPSIQYIYPIFDTQCAYKSSQAWTFFVLCAFWLFDFRMFTTWVAFDRWEVTCISDGMGQTLARVYKLLSNSIDAFQNIYSFLADVGRKPTTNAELYMLSDFIDGLDTSRRDDILDVVPIPEYYSTKYQRVKQLRGYINQYYYEGPGTLNPAFEVLPEFESAFNKLNTDSMKMSAYHMQTQRTLCEFLKRDIHFTTPTILNRYMEHCGRCIDDSNESSGSERPSAISGHKKWRDIHWAVSHARQAATRWDPVIGSHFAGMCANLLKPEQVSDESIRLISIVYPSLVESHQQSCLNPPPFTLIKGVQEWIDQMPEDPNKFITKVDHAQFVLYSMVHKTNIFKGRSHMPDSEKQYLRSFAQFFVDFFDREDISNEQRKNFWAANHTDSSLVCLRDYLKQNPPPHSS